MKKEKIDYADFSKNLAKNETSTFKLDIYYNKADSRCWTALVNQGVDNIIVTYHTNKEFLGDSSFDILSSDRIFSGVDPEHIYDILDELLTPNLVS